MDTISQICVSELDVRVLAESGLPLELRQFSEAAYELDGDELAGVMRLVEMLLWSTELPGGPVLMHVRPIEGGPLGWAVVAQVESPGTDDVFYQAHFAEVNSLTA